MALEYVAAYYSYLDLLEELSDAECGRLFKACLTYGKTGAAPELRGNERFVWPGIRSQIDRDAEKYKMRCEQNRNNRQRSLTDDNDGKRPSTKSTKTKTKEKEKAKEKTKTKESETGDIPHTPFPGACPDLCNAFTSWLTYKQERKEGYTPTGLQALCTRIEKAAREHGQLSVAALIRDCMAASWKGIIFDRLKAEKQECMREHGATGDANAAGDGSYRGFKARSALDDAD